MNIPETYDYLVCARRDLWAKLESVPDEALSRPLLDGSMRHTAQIAVLLRTQGIKPPSLDLLFYLPSS
jgi:uncharacterized damage-inducible protein DinB